MRREPRRACIFFPHTEHRLNADWMFYFLFIYVYAKKLARDVLCKETDEKHKPQWTTFSGAREKC